MIRKILILVTILFGIFPAVFSQSGVTAKLIKPDSSEEGVVEPQFPKGEEALYKYLSDNIKYPTLLVNIEMEGDVHVKFTIDKVGAVKNVEIIRGFDPLADDEVVEVIRKMPDWIPGADISGNTTDLSIELLVTFTINEELRNRLKELEEKGTDSQDSSKTEESSQTEEILDSNENSVKSDTLLNKLPEYPGGQKALEEYLKANLKYPKKAIQLMIQGRVILNLFVSAEGEITRVELIRGIYSECNEEAYFLVKKMPKWNPGLKDGKPTAMQVILPIPFELPK